MAAILTCRTKNRQHTDGDNENISLQVALAPTLSTLGAWRRPDVLLAFLRGRGNLVSQHRDDETTVLTKLAQTPSCNKKSAIPAQHRQEQTS